jgi:hypothetical protein
MAPDYNYACAYFYDNQGVEWTAPSSLSVAPGVNDSRTMHFDQDAAQGAWYLLPYWGSGAPGTNAALVLENWPAGRQASFYGYSQDPDSTVWDDWPYYVEADGTQYLAGGITIPRTATPGYAYVLHVYRYDDSASGLDLRAYFQVCTLAASRSSVKLGSGVQLSGVIPTQGHWGSEPGAAKQVTIYQRTKAAGPPDDWNAATKGWRKVGDVRADGFGKFRTGSLRPQRTTWYIVRYPGDDWYWRGYTAVTKVTVR